ncbi:Alcohol dehydrogenase superfamily, zinc-type [Corchorus olitorius]|uniref:Alcohol dehydrogenase superfamily, zinc-type n=1 Tax=Corchorus olitorius TaxID=93759 RepID=A0A1R3JTN7_9ROSI|nr:Alcohol dehydrogenase superfamily, zinc-type [Corchorus olitorius]
MLLSVINHHDHPTATTGCKKPKTLQFHDFVVVLLIIIIKRREKSTSNKTSLIKQRKKTVASALNKITVILEAKKLETLPGDSQCSVYRNRGRITTEENGQSYQGSSTWRTRGLSFLSNAFICFALINCVLKWEDVELGELKEGEIRIKNKAIGLNFLDVYYRKGVLKTATMPFTPGFEAVGEVVAMGPGVTSRKVGDLVGYAYLSVGSYAEEQILPADHVVPIPPSIDPFFAASILLKGMTAQYLVRRTFKVVCIVTNCITI